MWKKIASHILRNRVGILIGMSLFFILMVSTSYFLGVKFTTTNAEIIPSSDPVMVNFRDFTKTFGNEDNLITIGYYGDEIGEGNHFSEWQKMMEEIKNLEGIDGIFSITEAQKLVKDSINGGFKSENIISKKDYDNWDKMQSEIEKFPFYESLLFNTNSDAKQVIIYMKPEVVDSKLRITTVLKINKLVEEFKKKTGVNLYFSGMPVIRTMNSEQVKGETISFIVASLLITCFIFFLFFRSFRATAVAVSVVISAVALCFMMMSILNFEITLLTALVPPLLIVIGIPNCIYLINKYQSEYKEHKNKIKALQRMIIHVGNPAMLTNFTTAFGFLTFIFTGSSTLREFGIIASTNIIGIFIFSMLIIPTAYSYFPKPKKRHLKHHGRSWTNSVLDWMRNMVFNHRPYVYISLVVIVIISVFGILQMRTSGNLLDDMSKKAQFYKDISFFDDEFGGVLPLEIIVDTKRPNGVSSLNTLNKMDRLNLFIDSLDTSSKTLSITELVKFAKQGYYGNSSEFYNLPTQQERAFILKEIRASRGNQNLLTNYVDSTGSKARMTTLLRNLESDKMESVIADIKKATNDIFPQEQFTTYITGMAYVFMRGTTFLTKNLLISLSLAILLIALFMAFMFRSSQMILIALIPNLLPLITTAGLMGFLDIPIKPSTILVFSIAFGIAVDDTIHFLAKYRQDLKFFKGDIKKSVEVAIEEVGNSMFYTSVVLFAGFSVFLFSGFMGIVALGGLVAFTLMIAMISNLVLLPSLLMSYDKFITKSFKNPDIDFFEEENKDDELFS